MNSRQMSTQAVIARFRDAFRERRQKLYTVSAQSFHATLQKAPGGDAAVASAQTEHCVLCWCDTGVPRETPISERGCYVEGCGQLCIGCWKRLKNRSSE